ncbi:MAG TPA: hypothetical protein VGM44_15855 [Polyangiaceae bacterium]|jgi:hypothetical protein
MHVRKLHAFLGFFALVTAMGCSAAPQDSETVESTQQALGVPNPNPVWVSATTPFTHPDWSTYNAPFEMTFSLGDPDGATTSFVAGNTAKSALIYDGTLLFKCSPTDTAHRIDITDDDGDYIGPNGQATTDQNTLIADGMPCNTLSMTVSADFIWHAALPPFSAGFIEGQTITGNGYNFFDAEVLLSSASPLTHTNNMNFNHLINSHQLVIRYAESSPTSAVADVKLINASTSATLFDKPNVSFPRVVGTGYAQWGTVAIPFTSASSWPQVYARVTYTSGSSVYLDSVWIL